MINPLSTHYWPPFWGKTPLLAQPAQPLTHNLDEFAGFTVVKNHPQHQSRVRCKKHMMNWWTHVVRVFYDVFVACPVIFPRFFQDLLGFSQHFSRLSSSQSPVERVALLLLKLFTAKQSSSGGSSGAMSRQDFTALVPWTFQDENGWFNRNWTNKHGNVVLDHQVWEFNHSKLVISWDFRGISQEWNSDVP